MGGLIPAEAFQPQGDLIASSREKVKYPGRSISFKRELKRGESFIAGRMFSIGGNEFDKITIARDGFPMFPRWGIICSLLFYLKLNFCKDRKRERFLIKIRKLEIMGYSPFENTKGSLVETAFIFINRTTKMLQRLHHMRSLHP